MIIPSPEIWHRDDFPILCNWRKLWRVAEVGVDRGDYAEMFLSRWIGHHYYAIDDYGPYPDMPGDRQADFLFAATRLERFGSRARLIKGESMKIASTFFEGSLDFVYIDGSHDYESVISDLESWWPTLSEPGIIAGHDWTTQPAHQGVIPAVTDFARDHERIVYLTAVEGYNQETCPSWYIYRNGMPDGATWRRC